MYISKLRLGYLKQELLNSIKPNSKIHITNNSDIIYKKHKQNNSYKPVGLWYSFGLEWLDFIIDSGMDFYLDKKLHTFLIDTNELKILKISNIEEMGNFFNEFKENNDYSNLLSLRNIAGIDWIKVSEIYDGIEIYPYLYEGRRKHNWYYGWDVASGCIWNTEKLKHILHILT